MRTIPMHECKYTILVNERRPGIFASIHACSECGGWYSISVGFNTIEEHRNYGEIKGCKNAMKWWLSHGYRYKKSKGTEMEIIEL